MNLWLLSSLFVGAMALTACSSSDDPIPSTPAVTPGQPIDPTTMRMAALSGFVHDVDGNAISGVTVTSGTESVTTDGQGGFVLTKVGTNQGRTVVKFTKYGYVEIVRAAEQLNGDVWDVVMVNVSSWGSDNYVATNFDAYEGKTTTVDDMTVDLQGQGIVLASTGAGFDGWVNEEVVYLNPDKPNFAAMMPGGDLAAVRTDNSQVQLISYGMTKVDLTDNSGNKLQLAAGKPATMTFPVPEKFKDNTPDEIPLWSFNEETGLWEEEGIATYDASNNVYVGQVPHFSWVNLDYPEVRTSLTVVVKDEAGNLLPHIKVDVDGQKSVYTNTSGQAKCYVPKNTAFYITVHAEDYANYGGEQIVVQVSENELGDQGGTKEIVLPTVGHISGTVTNQGEGNNVATIWIEYGENKETSRVHSDLEGKFFIIAPADYKGEAKLKVRSADGKVKTVDITLDGTDQAFNISFVSDTNAGGTAVITWGKETFTLPFDAVETDYEGGVVIVGNSFYFTTGWGGEKEMSDDGFAYADLQLATYQEGQTKFTGATFNVRKEGGSDGMIGAWIGDAEVTITPQDGGNYRIQAAGYGQFEGRWEEQEGQERQQAHATLDVTAPVYAKGEKLQNVTAAQGLFPSFTPYIPGRTVDCAIRITECQALGKGGHLMYRDSELGVTEYQALVEEAKKTLGEPINEYLYDDDYNHYGSSTFQKGDKYLKINWNGYNNNWADISEASIAIWDLREYTGGTITVTVYEGYTLEPSARVKADKFWQARKK